MILSLEKFKDQVYACWIGKNIGGTMGTPYEGKRQMNDIHGFVTEPNVVLPNDDLDLQLVWLHAMEQNGTKNIHSAMLGEYWLSYITPHWNEYGIGKINMRRGILPGASGDLENTWQNSNGAWIRTEIWACTCPGLPHLAARNAREDARVDHGAGEGTFAASFVAGMQSYAFVEKDLRRCIEVGLSCIPESCRMAQSVRYVLSLYDRGIDYREARNLVFKLNEDIGNGWFEAPTNVSYAIIGLLWGEGDFKKSMIYAINCGDDTDCTGATVGATLGILGGTRSIPDDWREHIGDEIVTISIAKGNHGRFLPKSCTQLTERVVKLAKASLYSYNAAISEHHYIRGFIKVPVSFGDEEQIPDDLFELTKRTIADLLTGDSEGVLPYTCDYSNFMFSARVTFLREPVIGENDEIDLRITFKTNWCFESEPFVLALRWFLPESFSVEGRKNVFMGGFSDHYRGEQTLTFKIRSKDLVSAENRIVLEAMPKGRATPFYISFVLLG